MTNKNRPTCENCKHSACYGYQSYGCEHPDHRDNFVSLRYPACHGFEPRR